MLVLTAFLAFILIGILTRLAGVFGWQFLPSTSWIKDSGWLGFWAAAVPAVGIFALLIWGRVKLGYDKQPITFFLSVCFLPVIFGFMGRDAAVTGVPLIYTAIAGEPTELTYVVDRVAGHNGRRCKNIIYLRDMNFMNGSICNVPSEYNYAFTPGKRIFVSGRGTYYGVFVDTVSVDAP